jgi:hypothetical protein
LNGLRNFWQIAVRVSRQEKAAQPDHAGLDPVFVIVLSWIRTELRAVSAFTE